MTGPTFAVTEDQATLRDWLHGFAVDVVRPAAAEWDEREETPWPVIAEAARAGICSLDLFASAWADERDISLPVVMDQQIQRLIVSRAVSGHQTP